MRWQRSRTKPLYDGRSTALPQRIVVKVRRENTRYVEYWTLLLTAADNSLALFVVLIGLYAAQVCFLKGLNKRHGKTRESMGKRAVLVDKSMNRVQAAATDGASEDQDEDLTGQQAFDDKTDWENEDFIFVY